MDFIGQLEKWHIANRFQNIIDAVIALPPEERTMEMKGRMASAHNNLSEYEKALEILEAETHDDDARWVYRKAYALYYLNREIEAESCFRLAGELDPKDADAPYYLIQIYFTYMDRPEALDAAIAKLKALSPETYHELSGLPEFSAYCTIKDLEIFPQAELSYEQKLSLSHAYYSLNRYPKALDTLEAASGQGAEDPSYYYALGLVFFHLKRPAEAEKAMRTCLALCPESTGPWYVLEALYKEDQSKKAEYEEAAAKTAALRAGQEGGEENSEESPKSYQEAWEDLVGALSRSTSPAQWNDLRYWEQEMLSLNSLATAVLARGFQKFFEEDGDRVYPYAMKGFAAVHNDDSIPGNPLYEEGDEVVERSTEAWLALGLCWNALKEAYECFSLGKNLETQDALFTENYWGFVYAAFWHYETLVRTKEAEK